MTERPHHSRTSMAHHSNLGARVAALLLVVATVTVTRAESVAVRYVEGVSHGYLRLRTMAGQVLADGELLQHRRGARVISRLIFRFRDGSRFDETTVFLQQRQFRLVSDHVVQRGPAFPQPMDTSIDASSGNVTVRYRDHDGKEKVESEHLDLPADVANGMIQTLLKNVNPKAPPQSFAYVASTPKPRLVKLVISTAAPDRVAGGGATSTATHYVLKVDIGGLTGALASVLGKDPPDSHVWVVGGEAPGFVGAMMPFYSDGPLWRVELAAPQLGTPK
jgi:hypothetical protein